MIVSGDIFVTVIVCTYNRADRLLECLQSLADQTTPVERYEVIVVENACTDHTTRVIERFALRHPHFRMVQEPQPGKSRALNTGLRYARGTHVAFIDDDARAPRPWVEQIVTTFANTAPAPAIVAGSILPVYEQSPPSWWKQLVDLHAEQSAAFLKPGWDFYKVCGSNMAFHKDVLIECGGFAVNRGPVGGSYRMGEDTEAVLRVAARHPRVWYDPSLTVEHWVPMEKMTLYHLMQRRYLSGVAMSELEHTVLLSRRSLAVLVARMRRHLVRKTDVSAVRGAVDHVTSPSSLPPGSQRLLVGIISCALWLTEKVGRIRGARLLRLCRHRPACPTSLPL